VLTLAGGALAASLAFGQGAAQPPTPAQGQGRGGAPFAWGDKNNDGLCDITGRPVGQGRAARAAGQAPGRAWMGRRGGRGRCCGMGMARGCMGQPQPQATPERKPEPKK
jgi:hypothetical protein